jgi:tetratricopeptide (TPR) repeat protein
VRRLLPVILAIVCGPRALPGQRLIVKTSIAELEEAAHRDSLDPAARYNLALGYWSKQQWDQVETELRAALSIDSRFAPGYLALAYLPQADGKAWREDVVVLIGGRQLHRYIAVDTVVQQFDRLYRRAFLIDPLVDIRIVVATEWRGGTINRLDRAVYAYDDGKWDEAFRRFGDMVADSTEYQGEKSRLYEEILWYHALAAARLGQYEPAIRDLSDLVERSQQRETSDTLYRWPLRTNEYRYTLAFLKQRASDRQGALQGYREALASDLGLYMAHVHMAEIYEAAGMWTDAVAARRDAIAANPGDPSLLLDLGKTLANAAHWTEAEESLQEAADANPRDVRVYFYLGAVEQQLGKTETARAAFSRFISLAPTRYGPQVTNAKQRLSSLQ